MDFYHTINYGQVPNYDNVMLGYDNNMSYLPAHTEVSSISNNEYSFGYNPMKGTLQSADNRYYHEQNYQMDTSNYFNSGYQCNSNGTSLPPSPLLHSGYTPQYNNNYNMSGMNHNYTQFNPMDTLQCPQQPLYYTPVDESMYAQERGYYGYNSLSNTTCVDLMKDDDRNSMANASTCDSTPLFMPTPFEPINDGFELNHPHAYGYMNYPSVCTLETDTTSEEAIIEISNEIARNVQFLPDKDGNGKYSLDKNHPIHCVWRDLNRGHCSWRCRWWYNGKRLSKNFNVKRFGDFEAMRMAITMKIRNSTPVERLQLLKEQREAVRNHLELLRHQDRHISHDDTAYANYTPNFPERRAKLINNTKKLQRENWERLAWTYIKTPETQSGEATIVCRLCAKTTRCSRSRNLQQAHIMHLIRMHKNPWKQYIYTGGLTKMCKSAIDALYEQYDFGPDYQWNLRPGLKRPEPAFP